jgi:hypothetical protein
MDLETSHDGFASQIRAVREERERLIAHGSQEATLQTQMVRRRHI